MLSRATFESLCERCISNSVADGGAHKGFDGSLARVRQTSPFSSPSSTIMESTALSISSK
jgi:hypothetical protein